MTAIYVNNYRGFNDTTIPVFPVNFFVGENSTGKTSLLALIELLVSPVFWTTLDFNSGDYEFGGFSDIVSAGAVNPKEFQLGIIHNNDIEQSSVSCYMTHFRRGSQGLPILTLLSHYCNEQLATLVLSRKRIGVRLLNDIVPISDWSCPDELFAYVNFQNTSIKKGYKYLDTSEYRDVVRRRPLMTLPMVLSQLFENIVCEELTQLIPPMATTRYAGLAPIRTTPKRTYDGYVKPWSSDGEHTPYVIRSSLASTKEKARRFVADLHSFGRESGLFHGVEIKRFGRAVDSPFELNVSLDDITLRVNSVGYGVSQALPVVVETLMRSHSWLAIQQPEVHLHPRAQAALGDLLFQSANSASNTLFVETHSDYIIDRFLLAMRDEQVGANFAQICFFERDSGMNRIWLMPIGTSGEYPKDQPPGFRDFFLAEDKRILGL